MGQESTTEINSYLTDSITGIFGSYAVTGVIGLMVEVNQNNVCKGALFLLMGCRR